MMKFIEQYKTTGYDEGGFAILREKTDNPRTLLFLDIAEQVYHHYQSVLEQRNQIDFADMINDAHFYLQEIERQNLSLPYKYIIIDEFQDIARQRFNLTKRLSQITQAKVVAVGDDWQSIYSWRGADFTNILHFEKDFPGAKVVKLEQNYRSTKVIVDAANSLIAKNSARIPKECYSMGAQGEKIKLIQAYTEQEEAVLIASAILSRIQSERAEYQDFAILYRTNAQSRALEEALRRG